MLNLEKKIIKIEENSLRLVAFRYMGLKISHKKENTTCLLYVCKFFNQQIKYAQLYLKYI